MLLPLLLLAAVLAVRLRFVRDRSNQEPIAIASTISSVSSTKLPSLPEDAPNRTILDHIEQYVDVPAGAVGWKLFGKTGQTTVTGKTPEGGTLPYIRPQFTDAVKALDGKDIVIKGFMFPLDESEKQGLFLFGPFPVNCPFHYHVGPSLVMEVHADRHPVPFTYDAVTLHGRLQLLPDNKDGTLFYRLLDAQKIKE